MAQSLYDTIKQVRSTRVQQPQQQNLKQTIKDVRNKKNYTQQTEQPVMPELSDINLWDVAKEVPGVIGRGITKTGKFAANIGKAVLRAPQRAITSVAIEPAAGITSAITGKKVEPVYTPKTRMEQAMFGEEPVRGIFSRAEKAAEKIESMAGVPERGRKVALIAAPLLVAGMTTLDLLPIGGGEKQIAKESAKIAATKDVGKIAESLGRMFKGNKKSIDEVANRLIDVTDKKEVETVIRGLIKETPSSLKGEETIKGVVKETTTTKTDPQLEKLNNLDRQLAQVGKAREHILARMDTKITSKDSLDIQKLNKEIEKLSGQRDKIAKTLEVKNLEPRKELLKLQETGVKDFQESGEKIPYIVSNEDKKLVDELTNALAEAKPLRTAQAELYSAERGERLAEALQVRKNVRGETGFYAEKSKLGGKMEKISVDGIRNNFTQAKVDRLFNMAIDSPYITEWEKFSVRKGLVSMLEGKLPTESELALMREVYGEKLIDAISKNKTAFEKLKEAGYEMFNLPRALMSSFDLSFPFRQGIFVAARHPVMFSKEFAPMIKAAFSEKGYRAIMQGIKDRPTYLLMREYKLPLTEIGSKLTGREEVFMSSWAEKLPLIGRFIRGSNRAYTVFANKLRADLFDYMYKVGSDLGIQNNKKFLSSIADFIGSATGRGSLGKLESSAKLLNTIAFSPRLMASRLHLLNPFYYYKLHPVVRKEALKSLFSFLGTGMTFLGLAHMAGLEVGTNPNSSDFGKIKIGDTRIDIWGGFQQYIRLASQLMSGKMVSSTTGNITLLNEGYRPLNYADVLINFFQNKEAPLASFIHQMLEGKSFTGEDFEWKHELATRLTPMIIQDAVELVRAGDVELLPLELPAVFGIGVQTYFDKATKKLEQLEAMPLNEASKEMDRLIKEEPEMAKKINDLIEAEVIGLTPTDKMLKKLGVEDGSRAKHIIKELDKLKTNQEKFEYMQSLIDKKVITPNVNVQLTKILDERESK